MVKKEERAETLLISSLLWTFLGVHIDLQRGSWLSSLLCLIFLYLFLLMGKYQGQQVELIILWDTYYFSFYNVLKRKGMF